MDELAKQRAVGAVVIVGLAIIFVPLILDFGSDKRETPVDIVIPQPSIDSTTISIPVDSLGAKLEDAQIPAEPTVFEDTAQVSTPELAPVPIAQNATNDNDADGDMVGGGPIDEPVVTPSVPVPKQQAAAEKGGPVKPSAKSNPPANKTDTGKIVKVDPKASTPVTGARAWAVQVASFSERKSADALQQRLRKKGYRAFVVSSQLDGRTTVRVRIGPDLIRAEADRIRTEVERDFKLQAMVVRHR